MSAGNPHASATICQVLASEQATALISDNNASPTRHSLASAAFKESTLADARNRIRFYDAPCKGISWAKVKRPATIGKYATAARSRRSGCDCQKGALCAGA
jgi:hypothetical protein